MDKHPAVVALELACPRLNIPKNAALELVRFLFVKRFNEDDANFSPSSTLDLLWHEMLLNTDLRHTVEKLVGEVKHSTSTESQDDGLKVARRLKAMEAMAHEGWEPTLELWEEPGTLMSDLRAVTSRLPGSQKETTQYTCRFYDLFPSKRQARSRESGEDDASGAAQADIPPGAAVKRQRLSMEAEAPATTERISITVRWELSGDLTRFTVMPTTLVGSLERTYASLKHIERGTFFRLYSPDGESMHPQNTISYYDFEDSDEIVYMEVRTGC